MGNDFESIIETKERELKAWSSGGDQGESVRVPTSTHDAFSLLLQSVC